MKIVVFDSVYKFTKPIIDHWVGQGHTVFRDRYFDPSKVREYDISFFEFIDNSLMRASDPNDSFYKEISQPQDKNIVVRCHDIDAWCGNHEKINWSYVNHLVFVAEHIRDKVLSEIKLFSKTQVHLIKHGINSDIWPYKEPKPKDERKKLVYIGNINDPKRFETCLLLLAELPRDYSLHVVGRGLNTWRRGYIMHFIKENNLIVTFQEDLTQEQLVGFLDDKDFCIMPSEKEAFSFVVGECMLRGIKPIIHNWIGAKKTWPNELIWNTISEAKQLILEDKYDSKFYHQYVEEHYPIGKMLQQYDELLK